MPLTPVLDPEGAHLAALLRLGDFGGRRVLELGCGRVVCEIDGEPLFRTADAATAAVDALVRAGRLLEQAIDDHDVRKHYANGAELVADFADARRQLPDPALPRLRALAQPCVVRECCRLRRLQVR